MKGRLIPVGGRKPTRQRTLQPEAVVEANRAIGTPEPAMEKVPLRGSASVQARMKIERRASLEKPNVNAETVRVSRRPKFPGEESVKSILEEHRGSGAGMYVEEQAVNMGGPKQWKGESLTNLGTVRFRPGLNGESERLIVAKRRVMIAEPRGLSSRSTQKHQEPGRLTSVRV